MNLLINNFICHHHIIIYKNEKMVDILLFIRWITIILSLTGLYYISKVLMLTRTTKMELIKARIFLNDTFLKKIGSIGSRSVCGYYYHTLALTSQCGP